MNAFIPPVWHCCGSSIAIDSDSMKCTYMKDLFEISLISLEKSNFPSNFEKDFLFLAMDAIPFGTNTLIERKFQKFPFCFAHFIYLYLSLSLSFLQFTSCRADNIRLQWQWGDETRSGHCLCVHIAELSADGHCHSKWNRPSHLFERVIFTEI